MNDEQLDDLKQFILVTVSQSESRLTERMYIKIDDLKREMLEGFKGVGEAIDEVITQFDDRLTKLEQH